MSLIASSSIISCDLSPEEAGGGDVIDVAESSATSSTEYCTVSSNSV